MNYTSRAILNISEPFNVTSDSPKYILLAAYSRGEFKIYQKNITAIESAVNHPVIIVFDKSFDINETSNDKEYHPSNWNGYVSEGIETNKKVEVLF